MKLYNSLTNQTEELKAINDEQVSIYTCGPTVYDNVHIGNLTSFIYADTLARTIRAKYKVQHVMNITDVDDKTISRSQELYPKLSPKDALSKLTKDYEIKFKQDLAKLNINVDDYIFIKATESIELMQQLITKLLKSDFAYLSDDGIYFSIDKYRSSGKKYGKLVQLEFADDSSKSRINNDEYDKQTVHDFALWKFEKDGEPAWQYIIDGTDYPGRPGWHIECSAMSTSLLDQPFDIHTGGVDLKFPHHENEIAQSTTDTNADLLAKLFFHNEHLLINNQKMSKSLNNYFTLEDVTKQVSNPAAFRLLILQSNYKNRSDFSYENLNAADRRLVSYQNFSARRHQLDIKNNSPNIDFSSITELIERAMEDDLNSTKALSDLSVFINKIENNLINNSQNKEVTEFVNYIDSLFGLGLSEVDDIETSKKELLDERMKARNNKDWAKGDSIRNELIADGIGIIDTESTQIWYRL